MDERGSGNLQHDGFGTDHQCRRKFCCDESDKVDIHWVGYSYGVFCDTGNGVWVSDGEEGIGEEREVGMDGAQTIEEMAEKLDGVYDLNKVEDCRTMIEVLLRSIREKSATAQKDQDKLKMLALMVINGSPDAREKAKEALASSGTSKKEVLAFLMGMVKMSKEATAMSSKQLIAEVTDSVWDGLDMSGRESAILGEMISRMKKLVGA